MNSAQFFEHLRLRRLRQATKSNTPFHQWMEMCKECLDGTIEGDERHQLSIAYKMGASVWGATA